MWERNINWLPFACPQPGTWPTTQACALTGNRTGGLLVCRPALNPGPLLVWLSLAEAVLGTPKGWGFDSSSGHVSRLWVQSLFGACMEGPNRCFSLTSMFLSLSLSLCLPLSLRSIDIFFKKFKHF